MRRYRINERTLDDGKIEFVPECCEYIQKRWFRPDIEHWHNIGTIQHREYDRGYDTLKEAQEQIVRYERMHHFPAVTKSVIHEIQYVISNE